MSNSVLNYILPQEKGTTPKAWDARLAGAIPHDTTYYLKCMLGGVISCGLTHTLVTPQDVVKCNMQVDPGRYADGKGNAFSRIIAKEGAKSLIKGWFPTAVGYSLQGLFKFGLYEYFKDQYSNLAGEENSYKYRGMIYLAGSASAEFVADIALCPSEMVKVKMQTSPQGTFPTSTIPAISAMCSDRTSRFPFGSLVPLWSRQIPYTMAKFFFFEKVVEAFYTHIFTKPKNEYNKSTQLGITFASGYIAGIICALVSQPADSMISQLSKSSNSGKNFVQIINEVGMMNLCTKGLPTRIFMIGTLTSLQWWIYDTFKTYMGLGTTGGVIKK